jgi:endo-1,4-beta-xylanase
MNIQVSSLSPEIQKKINPYVGSVPDSVLKEQAKKYAEFMSIFLKHRDKFKRVTFWGINDTQSWRHDWPVIGRTDYPLLFNCHYEPKPALDAIANIRMA